MSISYAAVELAKRIFGETAGKKAMLIGAGEMAELAATHLLTAGIAHLFVANRTFSRAQELAERFKGTAIPFEIWPAAWSRPTSSSVPRARPGHHPGQGHPGRP